MKLGFDLVVIGHQFFRINSLLSSALQIFAGAIVFRKFFRNEYEIPIKFISLRYSSFYQAETIF